ncbi:MAG: SDR family oxidoreductase [Methanosarcinaceae archaeon]
MKIKNFKNKIIYIIGGSSGIGLSAANQLCGLGANIFIFARRVTQLNHAVKEISTHKISSNQLISFRQMDVSNYNQVCNVMNIAINEFGTPDILINCAGRAYPDYFENISYDAFDETMKINLYGIWNILSVLVPHIKRKGGSIVNTSSIGGFIGLFGYTDYCASKFAVIGFSEALRSELKQYNINVSVLCPPDTETPGLQIENKTKPNETRAISASVKIMTPEVVAKELIRGIQKNKFLIIPSMNGKFTFLMKRLFPSLVEFVMDRQIKKAN